MNSDMQNKNIQRGSGQTRVASRPAGQTAQRRPYAEGTASSARVQAETPRNAGSQQKSGGSRPAKKTISVRPGSNGIWIIVLGVICIVALIVYLTRGGGKAAEPVSHSVTISEVMMSNSGTVPDETGNFPDWIELHNKTGETIDVGGYGLSDDKLGTVKWTIPAGTKIEPNGYLIIYCSGDPSRGPFHAAFKLSSSDVITLSTEAGTIIEQIQLKPVGSGKTLARNVSGEFEEMNPSPGQSNDSAGQQKFLETISAVSNESIGVFINEFMASNASTIMGPDGTYCDWIELYNTTNHAVDLSGYGISDTSTQPLKYVFPKGTTIPAQGVLLIYCTGKEGTDPVTVEAPFGLRAYKEEIVFATPQGKILDSVSYERQETDVSTMRSPDGTGSWQKTTQPTPGYPNTDAGLAAFMAASSFGTGELFISELISANRSTLRQADLSYPDWIEIYNQSPEPVNLKGYSLSNNAKNPAKWTFPDVTINPGEFYVVLATGKNVTDTQKKNLETNFSLSAEGDRVFLFSPENKLVDKLVFGRAHADVSYGRSGSRLLFYSQPTPGTANAEGFPGYAEMPEFTVQAGVYNSPQTIDIAVPLGCNVTYTTDGSTPTENSTVYTGPVIVSSNTVLRARAFKTGLMPSDAATASYFILNGTNTMESHETPFSIVSVVTDRDNMFGPVNGIYVAGQVFAERTGEDAGAFTLKKDTANPEWKYANFNAQHYTHPDPLGLEWERPAHIEIIDSNGKLEYGDDLMIRIFGAFSRFKSQKGFSVVTRAGYGATSIDDKLFDTRSYTSYQSFTLRPSAMDCFMSKIRDILIQGLLEENGSILPTQAYRRAILYINGQYWGLYNIREKVNKYFLAQRYNITNPESIEILVGNGNSEASQISGQNSYLEYKQFIEWVGAHDLSNSENYSYVQSVIDVESFAEYCAMEIFVGNTDTGNIKFWRSKQYDNKWRWIPYDFDWAFNRNDENGESTTTGYRRNFFEKYFHPTGHGVAKGFSTVLSRGLLKNSNFRALFLQKCALMYNKVFTTENMLARINALAGEMETEMNYDTERWDGFSLKNWQRSIANLQDSAENVPEYFLKYCQSYFSLSDSEMIQLFGKVSSK